MGIIKNKIFIIKKSIKTKNFRIKRQIKKDIKLGKTSHIKRDIQTYTKS